MCYEPFVLVRQLVLLWSNCSSTTEQRRRGPSSLTPAGTGDCQVTALPRPPLLLHRARRRRAVGQPSMPEIRESTQLLYPNSATPSNRVEARGVIGGIGYLCSMGTPRFLRHPPAMAALPATIAMTVPHAVVPVIVSVGITGLVSVISRYLLLYARNRRARSIAEIRRAAIEGKIAVSDAEKLIRADISTDADSQQLQPGDTTGEERGPCGCAESSEGSPLRHDSTSEPSAHGRVILMLRRLRLL